jgi:LuxR family maltose regulon positive regulatory protein
VFSREDPGILRERLRRLERSRQVAHPCAGRAPRSAGRAQRRRAAVLRLRRGELTQREIASELQLSINTIKTPTRNIYRKLDGTAARRGDRPRARELGLI